MVVSAGNQQLRTQGKKTVTGGIIGLAIVILAWVIVAGVLAAILNTTIGNTFWTVSCPADPSCQVSTSFPSTDDGEEDDEEPTDGLKLRGQGFRCDPRAEYR